MIEITDTVKSKIQEILAKNPGKRLRISVEGDGCAGPYFGVSLDVPGDNEYITNVDGLEILVSDQVKRLSEITTIKIFENNIDKELM
jgi:Fe-S cluster assembly iron-binding protein IscA